MDSASSYTLGLVKYKTLRRHNTGGTSSHDDSDVVELLNKNFIFRLQFLLPSSGCDVTGRKGITIFHDGSIKLG
jgi:hypothetical protein